MGLFKKEQRNEEREMAPKLPELPRLPELTRMEEERGLYSQSVNQLPKFPNNSLGEKFSQNTIKEAVAGGKEGDEGFDADDFAEQMQMMQKPPRKQFTQEIPLDFQETSTKIKKAEPIFIRLDKFEESLHLFQKTKKQISEIETMVNNIKKLKDEEEKELEFWEKEMQSIKIQIEKVDKDIFSKIE